jgi:hypothetical protein
MLSRAISSMVFPVWFTLLLGLSAPALAADIPIVTVCEVLNHLAAYQGKTIIVVGRLSGTDEGSWLDQQCEQKLITNGFSWPSTISMTYVRGSTAPPPALPKHFAWNQEMLRKNLAQVQKTTKLRQAPERDMWSAQYGRLETRKEFITLQTSSGPMGYGFGHLNYAPAQLIFPEDGFCKFVAGECIPMR